MKKFYVAKKDIVSGIAKWGILQSPYNLPDNLEVVINKFTTLLTPLFPNHFIQISYEDIQSIVLFEGAKIPEFVEWNNRKNGRDGTGFVTAVSKPDPDDDFIDLHALARNVANDIIRQDFQTPIPLILKEGKSD